MRLGPEQRLAVYGTLAPGKSNHHQLADLEGDWRAGSVHGRLYPCGANVGLVLDEKAPSVSVEVFTSPDLPAHWRRLDDFEGAEYFRAKAAVECGGETVEAYIYVIDEPEG